MDGSGLYHSRPPSAAPLPSGRSPWRWFPWAVAATLFVVAVVNFGMMWFAVSTFPGLAVTHDFTLSNHYDKVLALAAQQKRLGWTLRTDLAAGRVPVLTMIGKDGAPLRTLHITATAQRPLGPRHEMALRFRETAPGRYVATAALPLDGAWDLAVIAAGESGRYLASRQVIAR